MEEGPAARMKVLRKKHLEFYVDTLSKYLLFLKLLDYDV